MPRASTIQFETIADLQERLGHIDAARIRLTPPPGTATERDLLELQRKTDRLFELVDGVLVEKIMGYLEGSLATWISHLLQTYLDTNDLGNLAGADATMKLMPRLVRIPDVSFTSWDKFPVRGEVPNTPIPELVPDLAVEVLSRKNTPGEQKRKLKDYFLSGVRLVWFVDPRKRTVQVFTAPDVFTTLTEEQTLDGGEVLPGLSLPVKKIFARVPRQEEKPATKRGRNKRK